MNLANRITLARIFLIPLFLAVASLKLPYGDVIAAAFFILAAITDGVDGYIARKQKSVTRVGKLLDPLADKLLITAALVSLVELGRLSGWVAVVIIGREFAVSGLRSIAAGEGIVIEASRLGKIKTISQIIAVVALFLKNLTLTLVNIPIGNIAMAVAVIITIWSGIDYFQRAGYLLSKKSI